MELRKRMLKDCLLEDSNTCSSNGFKSIPRRPPTNQFPMVPKRKQPNALQFVIKAVKNLRHSAGKSTPLGFLPRSLSRRLSSKNKVENQEGITTVRVKDIVRWNSSKNLHEGISQFEPSPPYRYTTKTMTTITISSTASGTSSSSWCDSDYTSEFLPSSWGGNVEDCSEKESGEKRLQCVGEDSSTAVTDADIEVGPEEDSQSENEQNSPVSVLEIQDGEEDDRASDSSFSQCLDNVERTKQKLMQTIQRFENLANVSAFSLDEWVSVNEESCIEGGRETDTTNDDENCDSGDRETEDEDADEVEEKAAQLWNRVKERHAIWIHEEHLIMDYFRDELMTQRTNSLNGDQDQHIEGQLVGVAKGWLQGKRVSEELERGTGEERRKACDREIERRDWNEKRTKKELEEVVLHIEEGIFSLLVDETIIELDQ